MATSANVSNTSQLICTIVKSLRKYRKQANVAVSCGLLLRTENRFSRRLETTTIVQNCNTSERVCSIDTEFAIPPKRNAENTSDNTRQDARRRYEKTHKGCSSVCTVVAFAITMLLRRSKAPVPQMHYLSTRLLMFSDLTILPKRKCPKRCDRTPKDDQHKHGFLNLQYPPSEKARNDAPELQKTTNINLEKQEREARGIGANTRPPNQCSYFRTLINKSYVGSETPTKARINILNKTLRADSGLGPRGPRNGAPRRQRTRPQGGLASR